MQIFIVQNIEFRKNSRARGLNGGGGSSATEPGSELRRKIHEMAEKGAHRVQK